MAGCSAIKADGTRCRNSAATGSEWCSSHDPARSEARREAASRAGRARHNGASRDLEAVKRQLRGLADRTVAGAIDPRVATAAGQLLNGWLRAVETQRRWYETDELRARLERLEDALEKREQEEGRWRGA